MYSAPETAAYCRLNIEHGYREADGFIRPGGYGQRGAVTWFVSTRRHEVRSVPCHLRGLAVGGLVGGLNEHGLGDVLACRHGHLLDLIKLLAGEERAVSSHHTHTAFLPSEHSDMH